MVITVAWWQDFISFVLNCPIHCLAASIRGTGYQDKFILIINDADKLPDDYLQLLSNLRVSIFNIDQMLTFINSSYPSLNRFSFIEKACFIRWLFIEDVLNHLNNPEKDIMVVDGDVLFLLSPKMCREAFSGRTFILQSCPAFTFLSNPVEWLQQYRSALDRLNNDLHGFSHTLLVNIEKMRKQTGHRDQIQRSINYSYRSPLASDQDFINALIANELLRQDSFLDLQIKYKLAMTENPIFFSQQFIECGLTPPIKFKIMSNNQVPVVLYVNDYTVTHLHFQSGFTYYCTAIFAYFNDAIKGFAKPHLRVTYPYEEFKPADQYNYTGRSLSRLQLYINIRELSSLIRYGMDVCHVPLELRDRYFPSTQTTFSLKDIFNPETWFRKDIEFYWED